MRELLKEEPAMTNDSLIVIRTFGNFLEADEAQIELLSAGIYSLLVSDEADPPPARATADAIALAVHRRDAEVANAVLTPLPH